MSGLVEYSWILHIQSVAVVFFFFLAEASEENPGLGVIGRGKEFNSLQIILFHIILKHRNWSFLKCC